MDFTDPFTWGMMAALSVPEQTVLWYFEPQLSLPMRLSVSVAMFAIHFAWNGFVPKAQTLRDELVWILGTAVYAYGVVGVRLETAIALVAADSVMTLSLR